jgi:hypothetical protein
VMAGPGRSPNAVGPRRRDRLRAAATALSRTHARARALTARIATSSVSPIDSRIRRAVDTDATSRKRRSSRRAPRGPKPTTRRRRASPPHRRTPARIVARAALSHAFKRRTKTVGEADTSSDQSQESLTRPRRETGPLRAGRLPLGTPTPVAVQLNLLSGRIGDVAMEILPAQADVSDSRHAETPSTTDESG